MTAPNLSPDLRDLRRRFVGLMILQACLIAAAVMFALVYFVGHRAWGLPAFVGALGVALVAQLRFVWMFRNWRG